MTAIQREIDELLLKALLDVEAHLRDTGSYGWAESVAVAAKRFSELSDEVDGFHILYGDPRAEVPQGVILANGHRG